MIKFKFKPNEVFKKLGLALEKQVLDPNKEYLCEIKEWRKPRSNDQNKMLWGIINKMAVELKTTDEELYLQMLKDYGVCDYMAIPENSKNLNAILETLKYYEVIDSKLENVKKIKVFIGSSHYDTKQMTRLIDGIIDECKQMGIYEEIKQDSEDLKSLVKER